MLGAHVLPDGGACFAVWAPHRRRVVLELDGRGVPLRRGRGGVWSVTVPDLAAGARYAYKLDGEGPYPDPRARALPEGVHGRAEVVDPRRFRWTDAGRPGLRMDGLTIYELHVGAFTPAGTFDAAIGELDELARLGVGAIELMPVSSFPGARNWGYDGVGHYAPAAVYGGPDGLARLVDAAHARGIGVLLDVVYNHLGPSGNYLRQFAPEYFTDRYQTPWGEALNYDGPGSRQVRNWAIDNAVQWLTDYHVDGLRLDATAEIHDASRRHVLAELAARCRAAVDRPVVLIAEDERRDVRRILNLGLDAQWADDFHHAVRTLLTPERQGYFQDYAGTAAEVAKAVKDGFVYTGQVSRRLGAPRGKPTGRAPARAFVFCTENHDQVGNRALGERLAHLVSPAAYRAASALLLLAPETPMLFMGQEFAASAPFQYFTDHEAELGRLVTEGRRKEFAAFDAFASGRAKVPDPQDDATFERSKLDFRERARNAGVYRLYRDLLALRMSDPTLRAQDRLRLRTTAHGERALAFVMGKRSGRRLVVANFGAADELALPGKWRLVLSTDDPAYGGAGGRAEAARGRVRMPAETSALFARA